MQFESVQDFINMGGYGFYVWWAFAINFLSIGLIWFVSVKKGCRILKDVKQEQLRKVRQQAAQNSDTLL